jgi:hypothetical protein
MSTHLLKIPQSHRHRKNHKAVVFLRSIYLDNTDQTQRISVLIHAVTLNLLNLENSQNTLSKVIGDRVLY